MGQKNHIRSEALYTLPEKESTEEDLRLLVMSCERYSKLKAIEAPDLLMDVEKVLIWRRLLSIFRTDTRHQQ